MFLGLGEGDRYFDRIISNTNRGVLSSMIGFFYMDFGNFSFWIFSLIMFLSILRNMDYEDSLERVRMILYQNRTRCFYKVINNIKKCVVIFGSFHVFETLCSLKNHFSSELMDVSLFHSSLLIF